MEQTDTFIHIRTQVSEGFLQTKRRVSERIGSVVKSIHMQYTWTWIIKTTSSCSQLWRPATTSCWSNRVAIQALLKAAFRIENPSRVLWNYRVRLEKHKTLWSGSRRNQLETQWNFLSPLILTFIRICTGFEACTNQESDYRPHQRQEKHQETPLFRWDNET